MSDTDSLDYLQTGFDPSSLTVPRLRSILVSHDISYPSGAKKSQLIEIFVENVLPQSRKILSARARARRTSKGITDAESSQESTVTREEEDKMPPPPTPRARSTRKASSRARTDDSESEVSAVRSPVKRTPRASSAKHARTSDTETGTDQDAIRRTVRKSRKSEAPTPAPAALPAPVSKIRYEDIDDGAGVTRKDSRRESAFTSDNPFQSGSSPPTQTVSSERKRKSLGSSASKDLARRRTTSTSTTRRRTDGPQADDAFHPPTSATFEIPVSALNPPKDIDENGIEAGEEFTPEEQLELVRERVLHGENALGPPRPRRKKSKGFLKGPLAVAAIAAIFAYGAWYRQEKVAVGYCGIGRQPKEIIPDGVRDVIPEWTTLLVEPECETCPQNAFCSIDLQSECFPDFIKKPHPLSLGGLIPLPPTCEPDGQKNHKIQFVVNKAVEELRERRAKFECGELKDDAGAPEPSVEIDAEELKKEVSMKRRKGLSEQEFNDLWAGALGELEKRDEIVSAVDG